VVDFGTDPGAAAYRGLDALTFADGALVQVSISPPGDQLPLSVTGPSRVTEKIDTTAAGVHRAYAADPNSST